MRFLTRPHLDRVVVIRVRREKADGRAAGFDELLRPTHARLVDRDQPTRVDASDRALERRPLPMNVGSVALTRTPPFF